MLSGAVYGAVFGVISGVIIGVIIGALRAEMPVFVENRKSVRGSLIPSAEGGTA